MSTAMPKSGFDRTMTAIAIVVALVLLAPTLVIIPMSFGEDPFLTFPPRGFSLKWYADYFNSADWVRATLFSVKIASLTMLASVALGTAVALAVSRARLPALGFIQFIIVIPMVMPQIAVAVALLLFFQQLNMVGTISAFVLAHTCLAIPFVMFTVLSVFRRYNVDLDAAAMVCGASRLTVFRRITLPIIWPGVVSGGLFAFLISFDEPVIAFFISGVRDKALARKFFEDVELNVTPTLAAVATMLTVITILILVITSYVSNRSDKKSEN